MKELFEKYRRAKFPNEAIGANVLEAQGIPVDRVENALQIIKENGKYAGVIRDTPTGPFIIWTRQAFPRRRRRQPYRKMTSTTSCHQPQMEVRLRRRP